MKNFNLKRTLNLRSLTLVGIFALALFAISCDKESDDYLPASAELEMKSAENGKAVKKGDMSIADIVVASASDTINPQFTLLLAALEYAGLTGTFVGGDQYTVFAPTDQAFIDLVVALKLTEAADPFAAIDDALGVGTVANVLLYHVAEGRRAANSVVPKNNVRTIETLLGVTFDVNPDGSIDAVGNSANIIAANISASNGIIHVIDAVILPIN